MENSTLTVISLIAVVIVFAIGAFKKNPIHVGVLGLLAAYILGKIAGIADTKIMGFFPTTMFVRLFGIMFFFAIAQVNGAVELLAKKMISKTGSNAKLMPFFLFYTGVILGSIGVNSLAAVAMVSGIGISLAMASGTDPLLYGLAGAYGSVCGCYSPINEFTANITSACEQVGLQANLGAIYLFCLVAFSISFAVIYFIMGGHKAKGQVVNLDAKDIPAFNSKQIITLVAIPVVVALVLLFKFDIGWSALIVGVVCVLLGAAKSSDTLKKVSLPSLILICGVGTLINLVNELGGFALMSSALASIMSVNTVPPLMSLTASAMSLFTIARLCVITLIPTLPGIFEAIPQASVSMAIAATSAGAFASCIGPLSAGGAIVTSNIATQYGEEKATGYFTKLMLLGIVGAIVIALVSFLTGLIGIL